jgi:uncharacterized protein (DUF2267 family)
LSDEYYYEEGAETAGDGAAAGDGAPAPALDRRALLQSLADAGGEFGAAAALALEAYDDREAAATLAAAQVALAAEQSPRTIAQVMGELERQKALGLDADQAELTAAVEAVDELKASLRAETEARLAAELKSVIDGIYKAHIESGDPDDVARREAQRFAKDAEDMLRVDLATGGDLLDDNEKWNAWVVEDGNLRRERQVLDGMALSDWGHDAAVVAAAQAEFDEILAARMGAVVGGSSDE